MATNRLDEITKAVQRNAAVKPTGQAPTTKQATTSSQILSKLPKAGTAPGSLESAYKQNQQRITNTISPSVQQTTRGTLAKIQQMKSFDPTQAQSAMDMFKQLRYDPSSRYYNPYTQSTNRAINYMRELGMEVPDAPDDKWFEQNAWLKQYYVPTANTNSLSSTMTNKRASKESKLAYYYNQLEMAREDTAKAKAERERLNNYLTYWATQPDRDRSDEEIISQIDWKQYPTIAKMRETAARGTPMELNEAIDVSDDAMYAALWAARNGGSTGNVYQDMINSVTGVGNQYQRNEEVRRRLDYTSEDYAPYSVGSTMDKERQLFGVSGFDENWINANKNIMVTGTEEEQKGYQAVLEAYDFTQEADKELESLMTRLDKKLASEKNPEAVKKYFDSLLESGSYSSLVKMDKSMRKGNTGLLNTTHEIEYSHGLIEKYIDAECAKHQDDQDDIDFAANIATNVSEPARVTPTTQEPELIADALGPNDTRYMPEGALVADLTGRTQAAGSPATVSPTSEVNIDAAASTAARDVNLDNPPGLIEAGNIDINARPVVDRGDGTFSTEDSITLGYDDWFVVVPTVINGKVVDEKTAEEHFLQTGEHLGKFETEAEANQYAEALHERQEAFYGAEQPDQILKKSALPPPAAPMTEAQVEVTRQQESTLKDGIEMAEDTLTPSEQGYLETSGSMAFDYIKDTFAGIKNAWNTYAPGLLSENVKQVRQAHTTAILDSAQRMYDYDQNAENLAALKYRAGELEKIAEGKEYVGQEVETYVTRTLDIGGRPYSVALGLQNGEYVLQTIDGFNKDGNTYSVDDPAEWDALANSKEINDLVLNANETAAKITEQNQQYSELTDEEKNAIQAYKSVMLQIQDAEAWQEEHKTEYKEAKARFKADQKAYRESLYVNSKLGQDTTMLEQAEAAAAYITQFHDYEATVWSRYNPSDFYAEALQAPGADREAVLEAAKQGNDELLQELELARTVRDYYKDSGLNIPQEYLSNLDRHIAKLERDNQDYQYFSLCQNKDFDEIAQKGREIEYESRPQTQVMFGLIRNERNDWDINQYYAYQENGVYDEAGQFDDHGLKGLLGGLNSLMSKNELDTYYYLLGSGREKEAQQYAAYMADPTYGVLWTRQREETEKAAQDLVDSGAGGFLAGNALAVIMSPVSAISAAGHYAYSLISGNELSPDSPLMTFSHFRNATREESAREITREFGEGTPLQQIAQMGYEIVTNRADSAVNALFTGGLFAGDGSGFFQEAGREFLGALPMGVSASMDAAAEAKSKGASDAQAYGVACVTLLAETLTEAISLDNMRDAFKAGQEISTGTVKEFLKNWVLRAGPSEALGESLNDIIENFADEKIMGALSDHADRVWEYRMKGMSKDDAEAAARRDEMNSVLRTALISYISPGLDIVQTGAGRLEYYRQVTEEHQKAGDNRSMLQIMKGERKANRALESAGIINDGSVLVEDAVSSYGILESAKNGSASAKTAAVSTVLAGAKTGLAARSIADAASGRLTQILGTNNAPERVQSLIIGAAKEGINVQQVAQGLQNAALSEHSAAAEVLKSDAFQLATPDRQAAMIADTVRMDAANEAVTADILKSVHEYKVNRHTKNLIAEGGLETAKPAVDAAKKASRNARAAETLHEERQEARKAAQDALAAADGEVQRDPKAGAPIMAAALDQLKSAKAVEAEYAQKEETSRQLEEEAKGKADDAVGKAMKDIRQQAETMATEEEAQEAQADAEAAATEQERLVADAHRQADQAMTENAEAADVEDFIARNNPDATEEEKQHIREMFARIRPAMAEEQMQGLTPEQQAAADQDRRTAERSKFLNQVATRFGLDGIIEVDPANETDEGRRALADKLKGNGYYNPDTNQIVLNRNATTEDALYFVLGHELTHVTEKAGEYSSLADAILQLTFGEGVTYQGILNDMKAGRTNSPLARMVNDRRAQYEKATGHSYGDDYYLQEIVADNFGSLLRWDSENPETQQGLVNRLVQENPSTARKIFESLKSFLKKMVGAKGAWQTDMQRTVDMFAQALDNAQAVRQGSQARPQVTDIRSAIESAGLSIKTGTSRIYEDYSDVDYVYDSDGHRLGEIIGNAIQGAKDNKTLLNLGFTEKAYTTKESLYTYNADQGTTKHLLDRQGNETAAEELRGGTTVLDTEKLSLNSFNEAEQARTRAALLAAKDSQGRRLYTSEQVDKYMSDALGVASIIAGDRARLDFVATDNPLMTFLKKNQDYGFTLDASTLCAKRLLYQGTFNYVQHAMPDEVFTPEDLVDLVNIMNEMGYETPCGICYVESRRRWLDTYANEFIDRITNDPEAFIEKVFKKAPDEEKTALRERLAGEKPSIEDLTTTDGLEALRKNDPQMYKAFVAAMNAKGSANPKIVQPRAEYKGEIAKLTKKQIQSLKDIGGLRVQSFSDFETPHLLDMMQAVMDMAARGLTSQAYTKVPNFAWVFGDTGIKINLSLIGKGTGLDDNGNLIFDNKEGINFDEAMRLRNRYSKNVGTIIVGINDDHIVAAMGDPRIDFIIPFHKSGWSDLERKGIKSLQYYEDYTDTQNERKLFKDKNGKVIRNKDGSYKTVPAKESKIVNFEPVGAHAYWDFSKNGEWNARKYLKMCAEDGRIPKFNQFLVDNGDGSFSLPEGDDKRSKAIREGYWKTLIDFKMYDNDGNGAAQQEVTPNINMDQAQRVLNEYSLRRPSGNADTRMVDMKNNNDVPVATTAGDEFIRRIREKRAGKNPTPPNKPLEATPEIDVTKLGRSQFADEAPAGAANGTAAMASGAEAELGNTPSEYDYEDAIQTRQQMAIDAETGETIRHSLPVSDPDTLDFLNRQEERGDVTTTYRTMKLLDGKLVSPKASYINGKIEGDTQLGQWEEATEHPELIEFDQNGNPYFELEEKGRKTRARYNPYMHSSNLMLNDQFTGAYQYSGDNEKLGKFVTVECIVPNSEAESGYQAQYAKDPVGWTNWKAGGVAQKNEQLGGEPRKVFLSRWIKPVRIVPDSEVAQHYKKVLGDRDVEIPANVVTPSLLSELEKVGVKIGAPTPQQAKKYREMFGTRYSLPTEEVQEAAEKAFVNSKARTSDGKLMPVYHGTKADFNVFDTSVSGGSNGAAEGFGIYLTDNPEVSEAYGDRQISAYVNMERPARSDKKTIKKSELVKLIKAACEKEAQNFVDEGSYGSVSEALPDTWISNYVYTPDYRTIQDAYKAVADSILSMNDNDMDIVQEIMAGMGIRDYGRAMEFYHDILTPTTGIDGFWTTWKDAQTGATSNVMLAFDSSQIKSNENVTYDDQGNPIPLSERFNTSNPDIRYSLPADAPYMAAVERGEMDQAQKMVDEKAREAGYTIRGYHGTDAEFNAFDKSKAGRNWEGDSRFGPGFYFAHDDYSASRWTDGSRIINAWLKMQHPLDLRKAAPQDIVDAIKQRFDEDRRAGAASALVPMSEEEYQANIDRIEAGQINNPARFLAGLKYDSNGNMTDGIQEFLTDLGYDGIITDEEMVVFDPEQIKSADPVTYDDQGNVIPLSERFNKENPDIRYQLPDDSVLERQIREYLRNGGSLSRNPGPSLSQASIPMEGQNPMASFTGGPKQRQFGARTAQASDELAAQAKAWVKANNAYMPDTNAEQIDRAIAWIRGNKIDPNSDGLYESVQAIQAPDFDYMSSDGQARMAAVMGLAVAKNDIMTQTMMADAFNRQGTDLGRALQSRKIFRLMTPAGRIATLQKMLKNVEQELGAQGKLVDLTFPDWILTAASTATTEEEFNHVQKAAAQHLASKVPVNWKDKLTAWRMLSMLGNPRTHVRNVLGNALFMPAVGLKNKIGAALEIATRQKERTKTLGRASEEARAFAKLDAQEMEAILRGDAKYKDGNQVQQEQKIFGQGKGIVSRTAGKMMQGLSDFNGRMLENEDWIFLSRHYRNALAGYMTANKLTAEQMTGETLEKARVYAVQEAQKATYRDANAVASWLNEANRKHPGIGFVVNAVLPFKKTPANILKRGVEYSPVGLINALTRGARQLNMWNAYQNGELKVLPDKAISPTQFIDKLAAGLTGTGIMALGAILSHLGVATAGLDDDDDEFDKLRGKQEYSLTLPTASLFGHDVSFTVDWAAPVCMPFFVGATIMDVATRENKDVSIAGVLDSILGITEPVFNLSMLDGVNSLFNVSQYSEGNPITQIGEKILTNYATSYVPTFVGQVARTLDTTRRKAFVESGADLSTWRYALEGLENKLPWVSQSNIPYRNVWGEADVSGAGEAAIENFISPGYGNAIKDDPVVNELERIYRETGDKALIPKAASKTIGTTKLNADQYDRYVVSRGQTARETLEALMESTLWQICDDPTRAKMVSDAWTYANQLSQHEITGKKMDAWVLEANTAGTIVETLVSRAADSNRKAYLAEYGKSLAEALDQENGKDYDTCLAALENAGATDTNIKSSLRDYFKPIYQSAYMDGDRRTMEEIEEKLIETGIGFKMKDFEGWIPGNKDEDEESDYTKWLTTH